MKPINRLGLLVFSIIVMFVGLGIISHVSNVLMWGISIFAIGIMIYFYALDDK
jgi:predicted membrane protein